MTNATNLAGKDNPRRANGNPAETISLLVVVPGQLALPSRGQSRGPSRLRLQAWLAGLPHRLGTWLYRPNDTEAGWWHWEITELRGGFARSYRDVRFDVLRQLHELTGRRGALGAPARPDEPGSPPPD